MSRKGKSVERGMERGVNATESVIAMEPVRPKGEYKVLLLIGRSTGLGQIRVIRHKAA
jgi:hypothetical protein